MHIGKRRFPLLRLIPILLFVHGCFPARGLYFLLNSPKPDEHYHTFQPVLNAPTDSTPQMDAEKIPLPRRLTRVPRTLKQTPSVPISDAVFLYAIVADRRVPHFPHFPRERVDIDRPQTLPSAQPPGRAPPAAV